MRTWRSQQTYFAIQLCSFFKLSFCYPTFWYSTCCSSSPSDYPPFAFTLQALPVCYSTFNFLSSNRNPERRLTNLAHVSEAREIAREIFARCQALFRFFVRCWRIVRVFCSCTYNYEWSIERSAICSFASRWSTFCPASKSKSTR